MSLHTHTLYAPLILTYIHTNIQIYIHTYLAFCVSLYTHTLYVPLVLTYIHTLHTHIHTYIPDILCVAIHPSIIGSTYTHIHTYTTYTHTYIHTYLAFCVSLYTHTLYVPLILTYIHTHIHTYIPDILCVAIYPYIICPAYGNIERHNIARGQA